MRHYEQNLPPGKKGYFASTENVVAEFACQSRCEALRWNLAFVAGRSMWCRKARGDVIAFLHR